ncbi:GNAT family N-acetyltransferase [Altericista sp. CCNU0014]|uniref:GNAT family N-acetyltransferase n=1 Tax=Altericista sp. CCNU0014 TaxID=3082949 RepID=UPI00384ACA44
MNTIEIRPFEPSDLESFNRTLNTICAERRYLASVDGFSLEESRQFIESSLDAGTIHQVAAVGSQIVGWCDIIPHSEAGFTHVGRLGMGLLRDYRGRSLGTKLLSACLERAQNAGLEKVELQVFADNKAAIALYKKFGFRQEGLRQKGRKLEGQYQDILLMALMLEDFSKGENIPV